MVQHIKKVRREDAFTGLEAAIVLIAFVVVASVLSYVVLGAGFFTTQKSQKVIHSGMTQASSNLVLIGDVIGTRGDAGQNEIKYLQFIVGLGSGGSPIDMTRISMTFSTQDDIPYTVDYSTLSEPPPGKWVIQDATNNGILEAGESFMICVAPRDRLIPREQFLLEIQPETGATLRIYRTIPASITNTTLLY
jgi:flagellin FlaB